MKIKTIYIALALVFSATAASATTFNEGVLVSPASIGISSGPVTMANNFVDWYDFQVTLPSTVIATGNSIATGNPSGMQLSGVQLTSFSLYDGNHTSLLASGPISSVSMTPMTLYWSLVSYSTLLANHTYSIQVNGNAYDSNPAFNNYSLSLSTAPVPEPESYALFLAGLGLMGFVASRRSS